MNPHGHFKLHLIPSGIFYPATRNLLGDGVVINPPALVQRARRPGRGRLRLRQLLHQRRAHLVMPYHVLLDQLEERERGTAKLGTTSRGIGPAYVDKVARRGIRVVDLMEPDGFRAQLHVALARMRRIVTGYFGAGGADDELRPAIDEATDEDRIATTTWPPRERLRPHVVDGQALVDAALLDGQRILLEGQLGTMRDIDWGTYPYVTSSSPIPGGASIGAGLPAVAIDRVIGVAKAYTTAVGAGPLPTELLDAEGEALRERGVEYGTSTGRPRRCGWYDAVAVRFSVRLAGYSSIALTKLDVLDGSERIRVCVAYRDPADGSRMDDRAGLDIGLRAAGAGVRGPSGLEGRYDRLPRAWPAASGGTRLRRAPGGAGRRADRPRLGRPRARPDDRPRGRVGSGWPRPSVSWRRPWPASRCWQPVRRVLSPRSPRGRRSRAMTSGSSRRPAGTSGPRRRSPPLTAAWCCSWPIRRCATTAQDPGRRSPASSHRWRTASRGDPRHLGSARLRGRRLRPASGTAHLHRQSSGRQGARHAGM